MEEGPSGSGAGPGEVCPACGTFPGTTEEAETRGVDSETTEAIKPRTEENFVVGCLKTAKSVRQDRRRQREWQDDRTTGGRMDRRMSLTIKGLSGIAGPFAERIHFYPNQPRLNMTVC